MANLPRRIIKETQRLLQVKYFVKVPKQNLILITAKLEDLKHTYIRNRCLALWQSLMSRMQDISMWSVLFFFFWINSLNFW